MKTSNQKFTKLSRHEKKNRELWINVVDIIFDVAINIYEMDIKELSAKSKISKTTLYRLSKREFIYIHTNTLSRLFEATGLSFSAFVEAGVELPKQKAA